MNERWKMNAHGNWSCGGWHASRYISGGWVLQPGGRVYSSLAECQRVVESLR